MRKFLVRLLLFLIAAVAAAYLLYPIAIDQYLLYRNALLLKTYRQSAANKDALRASEEKQAIADWNNQQLQEGIVSIDDNSQLVSDTNESIWNGLGLGESWGGGSDEEKKTDWTTLLSAANGAISERTIAQTLERFLRAGGMIRPLIVQDPFTVESGDAASLLANDRNGVIGILEIPEVDLILPVYGERTEEHLESGLFYGPGSSLPIGGRGTHSLLAGSGGLDTPEALVDIQQTVRKALPDFKLDGPKMLEDMDQLKQGDLFLFTIMGETLSYQVDQIDTAPAGQTIRLRRDMSSEQMTLVSATRDGGRLVVHGKRIAPNENEEELLYEDTASEPPYWVNILTLAAPVMLFGLLVMFIVERFKAHRYRLPTEIK